MERRGSLIVISAPQTWGDQTPPCFLGGFCWQGKNEINCRLANKNQTLIWLSHAARVSVQHLLLPNKFGDCWLILVVSSLTVHTYTGRWWWYLMRGFNWENLVRVFLSVGGRCQEKNWLIWTRSYWRDPPHWRTMVINHWPMIINQRQKKTKTFLVAGFPECVESFWITLTVHRQHGKFPTTYIRAGWKFFHLTEELKTKSPPGPHNYIPRHLHCCL